MKKLVLIQNELKAPKNQFNSFGKYKYRSCEDILEAVKPVCQRHDCTVTVPTIIKEVLGIPFVEAIATIKCNETGEVLTVEAQAGIDVNKKGMDTAQCFGSSASYAKKYALSGLFLLDDTKDSDATNTHQPKKTTNAQQQKKTTNAHQPKKVKLTTSHEKYEDVVSALASGDYKIEQVNGKYDTSIVWAQLGEDVLKAQKKLKDATK